MCLKLEVTLPIIDSFLLMYSLRTGSIIIAAWTVLRSFLCYCLFVVATSEVLIKKKFPFGGITVTDMSIETVSPGSILPVYLCYVGIMLAESFLFAFSWYLVGGICAQRSKYLSKYLVCRLITIVAEVLFLVLLCIIHKLLIGWYLGFLFSTILEFYGYIVVYSYYCMLWECENPCKQDIIIVSS